MNWWDLQNGSDIRGVAIDGVKGEAVNLTPEAVLKISYVFSQWLSEGRGKKVTIAIGRDSRISGETLLLAAADGIGKAGHYAYDFGLASTPGMYMALLEKDLSLDGSIMITASHLPFNRNGLKFFTHEGGATKELIHELLIRAEKMVINYDLQYFKPIQSIDFMSRYAKRLQSLIIKETGQNRPFEGSRIIVDAGNGAGGFFVEKVLQPLGADTSGSLFLDPDGMFPNHVPNPEDKDALQFIQNQVIETKADLGIIFDTDVDRAALIDHQGKAINRNKLIALISAILLEKNDKRYIVTDSVTSEGLTEFIHERGGYHHRFKRGYKNVIDEGIRLNKIGKTSDLAIETSGHAAFRDNHFLDDGAYLTVQLLIAFAKQKKKNHLLTDYISNLKEPKEEKEIRLSLPSHDFKIYGGDVINKLKEWVPSVENWHIVEPNYEGIRVSCQSMTEQGWFLMRLSLHDPMLALNIESNVTGGCEKIEAKIMAWLQQFSDINRTL